MRRTSERFRDRGDPRNPSEPETPTHPFRGAPLSAGSERTPVDPFARLDAHDAPEPPQPEVSGTLRFLPLLGIVLLVAAVSVDVGMTFAARWTSVVTNSAPAKTSIAEASSVAKAQPPAAVPQVTAPPVPTSSSIEITTAAAAAPVPSPPLRADDGEKSGNARTADAAPLSGNTVQRITDTEIRFGLAAPFSGPAKEMGHQLKLGIETAFAAANENGRIVGRQLKLVTADDGYEPTRTLNAMKDLYEKEQVFGFVDNYGSPTALIYVPYALERHAIYFGAFTGANSLRHDPPDRYVFNYRAGYAEEADAVVRYLVKIRRLRPEEIAVLTQQDAYGDAGMDGVAKAVRALRGDNAAPILRMTYSRNTVNVEDAVALLRRQKTPIKAVVLVATYRPAEKFIEKTRDAHPDMIYATISGVGSTGLADELKLLGSRYADGVIVTQVVPAVDSYASVSLLYKKALAKYFPGEAPDYVSLESFLTANVLIEGLRRAGPQLDTEALVDTLEGMRDFDMGPGPRVNFGPAEHQAVHKVWGTQLDQNGQYHPIDLE
jgi:ABC-type branched-subunit amino acid transport system substrate-binding protein